ncbi:SOS response-associated peptidase family protein [Rhizobium leguminosarum]|uniref:SOS response-associated peptidase family protein n=1 Tax=Rhizobium leguminosarum TaxID=384 RepID=UPI001FED689B|nr:SOS response-associated peptidase family protein [Rhizobium leguminosarum]
MKFGFPPPAGRKGGPVFTFRSEGRHFVDSQRCLIPASAFFEFTGTKYPKAKHRFTMQRTPFFAIAGLWRDGEGNQPPSFAMLTTGPGKLQASHLGSAAKKAATGESLRLLSRNEPHDSADTQRHREQQHA